MSRFPLSPTALVLAAACMLPAVTTTTAPAPSTPPATAPVAGREAGPPPVRHDEDDPREDGERQRRHRRGGRDHFDFGPPVLPPGVQVPDWDALTPAQQQALAEHRDEWNQLPASRRVRMLEWVERRVRWDSLTPEQRERLREGARNFRDMPPELRDKMRASLQATQSLPEAERQRLFELWHGLTPEQRRAWLEAGGPGLSPEPVLE